MELGEFKTCVNASAIEWFLNDGSEVIKADLYHNAKSQKFIMHLELSVGVDNQEMIGKTLLACSELAFDYLEECASREIDTKLLEKLWATNHIQDAESYNSEDKQWDLNSSPCPIWGLESYFERPLFSDDYDHRFMLGEIFENWQTPDSLVIDLSVDTFDPSYGNYFKGRSNRFVETYQEWLKVIPYQVLSVQYFERLKRQGISN